MSSLTNFLTGYRVLEKRESPYNGQIVVEHTFADGNIIRVNKLTQSGGLVKTLWSKRLRDIQKYIAAPKSVLILGLGGGTLAKLVRHSWETVSITGVDIDPVIVDLGKTYLDLEKTNTSIVIEDAYSFVLDQSQKKIRYDVIFVDLYKGDDFPEQFTTETFYRGLQSLLTSQGIVVINRLYYGIKRTQAMKSLKLLETLFTVDVIHSNETSNVIFLCRAR
jgi:predicted membrane-bound spermidine synthase